MCCIVIWLPIAWQIKLLLVIFISVSAIYSVYMRGLLLLPWSWVMLSVNIKNELQLTCKSGERFAGTVRVDSVVTPYLTVIHFQLHHAGFIRRLLTSRIVILPDMINAEDYRQLRVWLRWGQPH